MSEQERALAVNTIGLDESSGGQHSTRRRTGKQGGNVYGHRSLCDRWWSDATRAARQMERPHLPLWVTGPQFESPDTVREAILARANHNLYGYDKLPEGYFEAVRDWYSRKHGFDIKEEWLSTHLRRGGGASFRDTRADKPGDAVLIQPPVYHPFPRAITLSGRRVATNP